MTLALFDLDNTLISGDSDNLWGEFLVEQGLVDPVVYGARNEAFYEDYKRGELDVYAYLEFVALALNDIPAENRDSLRQQFFDEKIKPIMLPKAQAVIEKHRAEGHTLMVITATSSFITAPIVERLDVELLLAPELECLDGCFTGGVVGVPTFQEGKVTRLQEWLESSGETMEGAYFYSDSHNDIPLLAKVDRPVAVDPDEKLLAYATEHNIEVMSLR
ncbi:HAD family hydrolase [Pseudoteredinibacter isoporae]|uniref:HAD superfamily hydrolase (TIGR01490 family) n=1 Tax=Pseudoteredinibacter isoporae TaxID=570281 RepID=A0A7X0MW27_9GAMM|nr:HAD family hydrolase [Pseudoteredinibacter isoporae]MBB6520459.1 HAD superfamily hydrolase (TIGR01490 family) [Pseudoteredinibacter isoporae]NHO86026.1 HAD family hydrolase [Pseudoteredinibacter isoporae]NIB25523.1 HAD family hydrolase [Pseudoteredinibacter isoporae]